MKKFLKALKAGTALITVIIIALITMMACNSNKKQESAKEQDRPKVLVLYYSQTGVTRQVAQELQRRLAADIDSIEAVAPYDGTFDETCERGLMELQNGDFPDVKPLHRDPADYDVIFIGYPIWFNTYANPMATLLKKTDLAGKKVVPFATFGSGGLEASMRNLAIVQPDADIAEGYGVREIRLAAMPGELDRFLIENGYVEGEIEPLPDFSEEQPVTPEEVKIFDAACGDYQFPLGTPVAASRRALKNGTEYRYSVDCADHEGNPASSTIYVIAVDGEKPVFTKVVR